MSCSRVRRMFADPDSARSALAEMDMFAPVVPVAELAAQRRDAIVAQRLRVPGLLETSLEA